MPDIFSVIAWAIALLALLVGAQVFGLVGLLAILVACVLILGLTGIASSRRRLRHRRQPDARFVATDEVFRDPASGELMRVHVNQATGERRYWRD